MEDFPVEIIFKIFDYTSPSGFYALKKTCEYFRSCATMYLQKKQPNFGYGPITKSLDNNKLTQYYFKKILHVPRISYSEEDVINNIQFYKDGLKYGPSVIIDCIDCNKEKPIGKFIATYDDIDNTYIFKIDKICVYKNARLVNTFSRNSQMPPNLLLLWLYLCRTNSIC